MTITSFPVVSASVSASENYQATIAGMTAISDSGLASITLVTVTDPARGGLFKVLSGTPASNGLAADSGTVFASDGGGFTFQRIYSGELYLSWFGSVGDGVTDDTAAIQAAIDASYGKILRFPRGTYLTTSVLTIQPIFGGTSQLPLTIQGEGFDANGGNGSTIIKVSHTGNGFELINSTGTNADARFIIDGLVIMGDGANASGGNGVHADRVNNLTVSNCYVTGMRNRGIYYKKCYGSNVRDTVLLSNRVWGFEAEEAFNIGMLVNVRAYSNGRLYSSTLCGNISLIGAGNENLGLVFDNVDVSYAGTTAFSLFKRSDSTLTSIAVSGGTATATTASAHGLSTGDLIGVVGATVDTNLNTTYSASITVTGATTFTFTTTAANATYTESTLLVGPSSHGFSAIATRGFEARMYCEDCIGPAVYVGSTVDNFAFRGGYWQGVTYGCKVICDAVDMGVFENMYFKGAQAELIISSAAGGNATIDVSENNSFADNAVLTLPDLYCRSGNFYSNAAPAGGTWRIGSFVLNNEFAGGGDTVGWMCSAAGTPGTWVTVNQVMQVFANHGDANATLTPLTSYPTNFWRSPITANRTVTLSTTGAVSGHKFRVTRTSGATGAFTLTVGGLKALAAGEWCDVEYDGSTWVLSAYGTL